MFFNALYGVNYFNFFAKEPSLSVRGIQKRMEYYANKTNLKISCHHLRHTMATQMLNADTDLSTIQDLLGQNSIRTTQRYCRISNPKVRRDYFKAMEVIMQRTADTICADVNETLPPL